MEKVVDLAYLGESKQRPEMEHTPSQRQGDDLADFPGGLVLA